MLHSILGFLFAFYSFFYLYKIVICIISYYKIYIKKSNTFDEIFKDNPVIKTPFLFYLTTFEILLYFASFIYASIHFFNS